MTGVAIAIVLLAAGGGIERPLPVAVAGLAAYAAVAAAWLLPRVLRSLRADHDLFLIVSVDSGLAIAGIGSIVAGMPLALAAFVAGLAITESPDAAEARRRLLPFRDLLAVLFFVAIGSLIDPSALARGAGWVVFVVALIVVTKVALAYVLSRLARLRAHPLRRFRPGRRRADGSPFRLRLSRASSCRPGSGSRRSPVGAPRLARR